ncbi:hypothetical protein ACIBG0_10540 [Nocardia sp. NPDC050630]|uniref:hypothetical protein n=1 Tax=Nocardia sp. NPDC050630 TaxID=3364321 RepID=UPI00379D82E8
MSRPSDKPGTVLRALSRRQDWTEDRFALEYDRAAAAVWGDRAGLAPNHRTIRRWMWGDSKPQEHHRPVLKRMFPGYEVEDLLQPFDRRSGAPLPAPHAGPTRTVSPDSTADLGSSARMQALISYVDASSPIKEHDIHPPVPVPRMPFYSYTTGGPCFTSSVVRGYLRDGGVERSR